MLRRAGRPAAGATVARLCRAESTLLSADPRPHVIAGLGARPRVGTSTLTALLAQVLSAIAPGRIAVLDADVARQPQRTLLAAGAGGDLGQLIATPAHRLSRRRVEGLVARDGSVPVLAGVERDRALDAGQLELALSLLRRRFPIVVLDLPGDSRPEVVAWAAERADHVIVVAPPDDWSVEIASWLAGLAAGRRAGQVTLVGGPGGRPGSGIDVLMPRDPVLDEGGRVSPAGLDPDTVAAVEEVAVRAVRAWRDVG
jgi:Mrp family chromosome partitioning ATPase